MPPAWNGGSEMLERYFMYPGVLKRMRRGPLVHEIEEIAGTLEQTGYSRATVRRYLSLVASFSRYAQSVRCTDPERINRTLMERFLVEFPTSPGTRSVARTALGHV